MTNLFALQCKESIYYISVKLNTQSSYLQLGNVKLQLCLKILRKDSKKFSNRMGVCSCDCFYSKLLSIITTVFFHKFYSAVTYGTTILQNKNRQWYQMWIQDPALTKGGCHVSPACAIQCNVFNFLNSLLTPNIFQGGVLNLLTPSVGSR